MKKINAHKKLSFSLLFNIGTGDKSGKISVNTLRCSPKGENSDFSAFPSAPHWNTRQPRGQRKVGLSSGFSALWEFSQGISWI